MGENPFIKPERIELVRQPDRSAVVVLERVQDGEPDHCVHGRTQCMRCESWCWLGDNSLAYLRAGKGVPLCVQCATEVIPRTSRPVTNLGDHLRADGPHT